MCESLPIKKFVYPKGEIMCVDGQVRAAYTGTKILRAELDISQIEIMAKKGERAVNLCADTHKRNLIYYIVYSHVKRGDLLDYVNINGDFILNNLTPSNVFLPRHQVVLNQLLSTGILQD